MKKDTNNYKQISIFVAGILGQILVFIIGNYADAVFSVAPVEALIISAIILLLSWLR